MNTISLCNDLAGSFREAMSRLATGVTLITTCGSEGQALGMLATAVSSVTAAPPTILVCINRSARIHADLTASGVFCVNFLADNQREIADRFGSSEGRDRRFQIGDWQTDATGAPVLAGSVAALDCKLSEMVDIGTHSVIFGQVAAVRLAATTARSTPLIYHARSYCTL
ncbi:flavin reductase family protein [Brucella tritici]|uniref:flavin reductase family protein n=1 Tax=Brucella tritici TaxID=94626 RepID=UPI002000B213|nr:flavin reductase family protein [Brucella tritici]